MSALLSDLLQWGFLRFGSENLFREHIFIHVSVIVPEHAFVTVEVNQTFVIENSADRFSLVWKRLECTRIVRLIITTNSNLIRFLEVRGEAERLISLLQ